MILQFILKLRLENVKTVLSQQHNHIYSKRPSERGHIVKPPVQNKPSKNRVFWGFI